MFFFNKKMVCSSSVFIFMANMLNSIMKSIVFFFPCLKDLIFHSVSAAFVLSLNVILISLTKSSQSWVPSSLSSSSSFLYVYMPATPPCQEQKRWTWYFSIFFSYFYFLFNLFSFGLFLELGLGLEWQRSCCHTAGHIRWYGHKSHDTWKDVKGSGRIMLYNIC